MWFLVSLFKHHNLACLCKTLPLSHKKLRCWNLKHYIHPQKRRLKCAYAFNTLQSKQNCTLAWWEGNNKRETQLCGQTASREREVELTWLTPSWLLLCEEKKEVRGKKVIWTCPNLSLKSGSDLSWPRMTHKGLYIYYTVCGEDKVCPCFLKLLDFDS